MEAVETRNEYRELIDRLRAGTEPLSFSSFNEFCKSPRHFIRYKLGEKEQTDSMVFGAAVHCLILEPDEFESRYAIAPKVNKRTKLGKAQWAAFCEANAGKTILKEDEYDQALGIAEAVYKNESSGWLINQFGVTEVKVEWEYYGYKWRGYIDGEGDHLLGDLKIVADAHPRKLRYKMFDMGYDRQAAMYTLLGGRKGKQYYLCAVDRGGNVSVHEITEGVMAVAMADIEYMMGQFQRCILRDLWHMSYDFHAPHGIYKISGR